METGGGLDVAFKSGSQRSLQSAPGFFCRLGCISKNVERSGCESDRHPCLKSQQAMGAPHPRFPVEFSGFRDVHAPFLKERRTRSLVLRRVQEIRGISLVFREMWDTTALNLQALGPTD